MDFGSVINLNLIQCTRANLQEIYLKFLFAI